MIEKELVIQSWKKTSIFCLWADFTIRFVQMGFYKPMDETTWLNIAKVTGGVPPFISMISWGFHRVWPTFSIHSISFFWHQLFTASSLFIQIGSQSCSKHILAMSYLVFNLVKTSTGWPLKSKEFFSDKAPVSNRW